MRINYAKLKKTYQEVGLDRGGQLLKEALKDGYIEPENFSIQEAAEEFMGRDFIRACNPMSEQPAAEILTEAGDAVDSTMFANITGQIVYSAMLAAYEQEAFVCTRLVRNVPTKLDGEKIPGIGMIGDKAAEIAEGQPYERAYVTEDYIETPSTIKRGLIVPVTKEAIFFDRTNLVLDRCRAVGEALGVLKEKKCSDVVAGITNNHSWKASAYDTYATATGATNGEAGGTGLVINKLTGNDLIDQTDIDNAEQLFADILDPNTSEPVVVNPTDILVMPARQWAAGRVANATELRYTAGTTGVESLGPNPIAGKYKIHVSRQIYRRIMYNGGGTAVSAANAKKYWFVGDFRRAFAWMQNWPITVVQAPPNSYDEFTRDIIYQFKASERGVAAVINPRYVVKNTG